MNNGALAYVRFLHRLGFDLYTDGRFRADFDRFRNDL